MVGDDKAAEKKPGLLARMFSGPRRLWQSSLAMRAAIVVAGMQVIFVATAWTLFLLDDASVPWRHSLSWWRVLVVLLLLALVPYLIYRGLKLWLEGDRSAFSDIDYAWNAGVAELERHGLRLNSLPVFLVLGSTSERQERSIMDASGLHFRVRAFPQGPAPLHWYANPDGLFLFCSDANRLSLLASKREKQRTRGPELNPAAAEDPTFTPPAEAAQAYAPPPDPAAAPQPAAPPGRAMPPQREIRGTIMLDQFLDQPGAAPPAGAGKAPGPAGRQPRGPEHGTLMLSDFASASVIASQAPAKPPAAAVASSAPPGARHVPFEPLAAVDATEQQERLQYICQLLAQARHPYCPVNGILTLLPFNMLQSSPTEATEVERAVRADLSTVQNTLELRAPVVALLVGLEEESGFRELVGRVGPERAAVQRFGRGFDVRSTATAEELENLCSHVCGTFEDWIHALFRETGALARPGNTRLYGLLCKVRSTLKTRLSSLMVGAFGENPRVAGSEHFLFSGIYFAATGPTEDLQAFVRGVIEKLMQEQEHIEWTPAALAHNSRYSWAANIGFAVDGVLLIVLATLLGRHFLR